MEKNKILNIFVDLKKIVIVKQKNTQFQKENVNVLTKKDFQEVNLQNYKHIAHNKTNLNVLLYKDVNLANHNNNVTQINN